MAFLYREHGVDNPIILTVNRVYSIVVTVDSGSNPLYLVIFHSAFRKHQPLHALNAL